MNHISKFPQISSRGRYNLRTGESFGKKKLYTLYPKKKFILIEKASEITIFIHGMRNSSWGAKRGALTLRQTLRKLGYKKHPVVAFSYDADVREAHKPSEYKRTLKVAGEIAKHNGIAHLGEYIHDLLSDNPKIKIHLVGHSLGCEVVYWALARLNICSCRPDHVTSVHLFGSPVELGMIELAGEMNKITNYYNPTDDVIIEGVDRGVCELPTCLVKNVQNVKNVKLVAEHHGFRAYAKELKKFP